MKLLLLSTIVLFSFSEIHAQQNDGSDYKTAIGVKVYPGAVTVKHFLNANTAVEGLGYLSADGFRVTGLYELHYDINGVEGLKWYVGGGGHVGIWSDAWKNKYPTREGGL